MDVFSEAAYEFYKKLMKVKIPFGVAEVGMNSNLQMFDYYCVVYSVKVVFSSL